MANTAATELARLTEASQANQNMAANAAAAATERGQQGASMSQPRPEGEKAEFPVPEALATAVVGSFILGPAGGLLLGAAQGWLGKREKQNILDQQAKKNEAISGSQDILRSQFDDLMAGAKNDNDREQLEALRTQQEAGFKYMLSGDPDLQGLGMSMVQKVQEEANGYARLQETQRIADETRKEQMKRELGERGFQRATALEDDFTAESAGYEPIMSSTNLALEALERGTPADLWAASTLVNKALDPTSVVRPEEAEAIGALGSLWDKAGTILERAAKGQSILPQQRRELSALIGSIRNGATQIQGAREARYKEQLADAEVPTKYWDQFNLTESVPAYEQGPLQNAEPAFKGSKGEGMANDYLEATRQDIFEGAEAVGKAFDKGMNAVEKMLTTPAKPSTSGQMRRRKVN